MCVLSIWACMCVIIRMCIQVDSLSKALSFSQHENLKLKTEIAKVHICPTTNSVLYSVQVWYPHHTTTTAIQGIHVFCDVSGTVEWAGSTGGSQASVAQRKRREG